MDPQPKSRSASGSFWVTAGDTSTISASFLPFFFSFLPPKEPQSRGSAGGSSVIAAGVSSTLPTAFLAIFLSFLPKLPHPASVVTSGSGSSVTIAGSSTSVIFLPFLSFFLVPNPPQSSVTLVSAGAGGGGGGEAGVRSSPFLPFFLSFLAPPHAPQVSSTAGVGSSVATPIVLTSMRSFPTSPATLFFLLFLSFLPVPNAPQSSAASAFFASAFASSSLDSSRLSKLPKSKPDDVVFFLVFFLFPKDQALLSASSIVVSAMSFVPASAAEKSHVFPPVSHLLPQPPKPKSLLVSLPVPKLRSIFGTSASRLMSSNSLVPLAFSAAGSLCNILATSAMGKLS